MCISPVLVPIKDKQGNVLRYSYVRCNKCGQCLKSNRYMWTLRLLSESHKYPFSRFLTFTYNDDSLPYLDHDFCFNKKHVQNYIKSLRNFFSLRYFITSEYGDDGFRPHYHCIIFITDSNGYSLSSVDKIISNFWKYGFTKFEKCCVETIQYVTSYMLQRQSLYISLLLKRFNCSYDELPKQFKPFMLCSKKPAIGQNLIDLFNDSDDGYLNFNGSRIRPSGYIARQLGFPNSNNTINEFGITDELYECMLNQYLETHPFNCSSDFNNDLSILNKQKFKISLFKHG